MPGTNLSRAEAAERSAVVSTESYRIDLDLATGSETTFSSVTEIEFSATPGASTFLDIIAASVDRVFLNGNELNPRRFADSRYPLENLAEKNTVRVESTMEYSHTGEGLHRYVDPADGEVYLYSQFEVGDARRVFANFEQPDLKAVYTFTVTAPAAWRVFSNSPTPEPVAHEERDGVATWNFSATEKMSTYLTSIVAGPYEGYDNDIYHSTNGREIPLGVWARKSLKEYLDPEELFLITKQGFEFYEANYGFPYPFRKYDQIFCPEYNAGAMEHPGNVTLVESYVFRTKPTGAIIDRRIITILHEQAHMWFGDLVTMKWWDDLWLNESFAEYMSHLAAVENTRMSDAWVTFLASEKSWATTEDQLPSTHPIAADMSDMRPSLLPGLLAAAQRNADKGHGDVALFEVSGTYENDAPEGQRRVAGGVRRGTASLVGAGRLWSNAAKGGGKPVDVYDAKADALAVIEACGLPMGNVQIEAGAPGWYHPGRSGTIKMGPKVVLGHFGEFHPKALGALDVSGALAGFEIFVDAMPEPKRKATRTKAALDLSPFQAVRRDFAFVVDRTVEAGAIMRAAAGADRKLIAGVTVFDVFEGASLGEGRKSVAIEVVIQPTDKTLTDEDFEALTARIVGNVAKATGATLRA